MNQDFLTQWGEAAYTIRLAFFWSALWAFALGYVVSSMIQVFVTQERMQRSLGDTNAKSVGLATCFGSLSPVQCSFAALATTRSLFQKGAGFVPAMAFLLASTNLVIELGIIISVFLSWHFVVGEYAGGIMLILISWLFIRLTQPQETHQASQRESKRRGRRFRRCARLEKAHPKLGRMEGRGDALPDGVEHGVERCDGGLHHCRDRGSFCAPLFL